MGSTIQAIIASDGSTTIHASTILNDLFEDYRYFRGEAEKIDRFRYPIQYKRMVRASIAVFFNYFEGVLNRWVAKIDPEFDLDVSVGAKLGKVRGEIRKRNRRSPDYLDVQQSKNLRNKLAHLKLGDKDSEIIEELLSGRFFRDAEHLINWLRIAAHLLDLELHDDPEKMMKPFVEALGGLQRSSSSELSEEDEELVRLAEMTFLELDAREAVDGNP